METEFNSLTSPLQMRAVLLAYLEVNDPARYKLSHMNNENDVVVIKRAPVAPNWTRLGVPYIVFLQESDGDILGPQF